ncbi:MAG: single-stranded-DNA-specific exonuclease RecJ [Chloroflexota bacterium]
MPSINKHWQISPPIPPEAGQNLLGYPPILRQILFNRGYHTHEAARQFLEALPPQGTEPGNMLGVPQAVERIQFALSQGEKIAVYGDYDADGVTATALLTQVLRSLGGDVIGYIPNRFDEGYGLNIEALDTLQQDGIQLVVTVDCGIRSPRETEHARQAGLDLIITDHHHPGAEMPAALAVINPKQPGENYPDQDLAGVGLAYKLAQALLEVAPPDSTIPEVHQYLDLVALGTIADLAPLVGENRALVRAGLGQIRRPHRQGLMSLIGAAGLNPEKISATDIGFMLGPRLNAAGRLESALAALRLLTTEDVAEAAGLAQKLDNQNRERQQITREIQSDAEKLALADDPNAMLLFAAHPEYNPGVVGLAASRLTEQYYRPAIVAHLGEEFTRGSCRSIPEFHITNALDQVADLLVHHGGHAAAAGFTVRNQDLPAMIERMKAIAQQALGHLDLRPVLRADIEIPLSDLHPSLLEDLAWLQPTGQSNPEAVFVSRGLRVVRFRAVGRENAHLRLSVSDGRITYDAIAFRQGHWQAQMPPHVDLLYSFETNEYNGRSSLQLNVRDLKPSGADD